MPFFRRKTVVIEVASFVDVYNHIAKNLYRGM